MVYLSHPERRPWSNDLAKPTVIRTSGPQPEHRNSSYHFLHLTPQELFAAQFFLQHWTSGRDLPCLDLGSGRRKCITPGTLLRKCKDETRYDIMWRSVSGLLSKGPRRQCVRFAF